MECSMKWDRWIKSEKVKSIEEFTELMLIEHFMNQIHPDMKYEITKSETKDVMEAGHHVGQLRASYGIRKGDFANKVRSNNYYRNVM